MTTDTISELREYVLVKRGMYYRPDNCGYTGILDKAGRYLESDADPESGIEAIHESAAPIFSEACLDDVKVSYLLNRVEAAEARNAMLEEALRPFAAVADEVPAEMEDSQIAFVSGVHRGAKVTYGDFRTARTALGHPHV